MKKVFQTGKRNQKKDRSKKGGDDRRRKGRKSAFLGERLIRGQSVLRFKKIVELLGTRKESCQIRGGAGGLSAPTTIEIHIALRRKRTPGTTRSSERRVRELNAAFLIRWNSNCHRGQKRRELKFRTPTVERSDKYYSENLGDAGE